MKDTVLHKAERSLFDATVVLQVVTKRFSQKTGAREVDVSRNTERMTVLGLATDRPYAREIKTRRLVDATTAIPLTHSLTVR